MSNSTGNNNKSQTVVQLTSLPDSKPKGLRSASFRLRLRSGGCFLGAVSIRIGFLYLKGSFERGL